MRRKNAWTTYNKKQLDELEKLCKNYLKFLVAQRLLVNIL